MKKPSAPGHRIVETTASASTETPVFDKDGYPTDETLRVVEEWKLPDGIPEWFEYIHEAWTYEDYFKSNEKFINLSTGGWSGNESLIEAMKKNVLWYIVWLQSRRGGHYIFELPNKEAEE